MSIIIKGNKKLRIMTKYFKYYTLVGLLSFVCISQIYGQKVCVPQFNDWGGDILYFDTEQNPPWTYYQEEYIFSGSASLTEKKQVCSNEFVLYKGNAYPLYISYEVSYGGPGYIRCAIIDWGINIVPIVSSTNAKGLFYIPLESLNSKMGNMHTIRIVFYVVNERNKNVTLISLADLFSDNSICETMNGNLSFTVKATFEEPEPEPEPEPEVIFDPEPEQGPTSSDQSFVLKKTYTNSIATAYLEQKQYFDGLGRPVQIVEKGITPSRKDLVVMQQYNGFRDSRSWLPAVVENNNGNYVNPSIVVSQAKTSYQDEKPYSFPMYEDSPLNQIIDQYSPGTDWHEKRKSIHAQYLTNITGVDSLDCMLYLINETSLTDTLITIRGGSYYPSGELYVTRMTDEDGNTSFEFKDKLGRVVLTRQIVRDSGIKNLHDTYYIYDDLGKLRAVLPPLASDAMKTGSSWSNGSSKLIRDYAYLYKYDHRNRCIAKRLPGTDWIYYVYDKADRLIYTQDGEQRLKEEWTFSIPDALGRIVLTGITKNLIDVNNKVIKAEYSQNGAYKGYSVFVDGTVIHFATNPVILSTSYYDNYDFRGMAEIPIAQTAYSALEGYGQWYTGTGGYHAKGLVTGALTAQFNPDGTVSPDFLYSVMYYDNKGQLIQTRSNNHLGGTETEYLAYNFTGQPLRKRHEHSEGSNTITEEYAYLYDHAGRLLTTTHRLNGGQEITLAENTYDELGRLKTNKKGNSENLKSSFDYNVRSWTKTITSPLFSQRLYYNDQHAGSTPQYNGNISAMEWQTEGENYTRGYTFAYDNLSRLTGAAYLQNGTANDNYRTAYTYDKHGNMLTTLRHGKTTATAYGIIDNLAMTYNGNQLVRVSDSGENISINNSSDFKDHTNGNGQYTYNRNGAMNSDSHKGILGISYNSLNLPTELAIKNTNTSGKTYYTYSASGVKLRTEHKSSSNLNYVPITGTGGDSNLDIVKITDYAGNKIYENGQLKRVLVSGGYIEDNVYHFYLTDHLGNNRMVINQNDSIVQRNHYYPFGMEFADNSGDDQPYKYNGKELDKMHGLNMYDYSARYMEPGVGRFMSYDPRAEDFYSWTPYMYSYNNPIRFIDPDGEGPGDVIKGFAKGFKDVLVSAVTASPIIIAHQVSQASSEDLKKAGNAFLEKGYQTSVPGYLDTAIKEYNSGGDGSKTGQLTGEIIGEAAVSAGLGLAGASAGTSTNAAKNANLGSKISKNFNLTAKEGSLEFYSTKIGDNVIEFGGEMSKTKDVLTIKGFDIDGGLTNKIGVAGLKEIINNFGKQQGVNKVIIEGAKRTTGANPGKTPSPLEFPIKYD